MIALRALHLLIVLALFLALAPAQALALRLAPRLAGRMQGLFCARLARRANLQIAVDGALSPRRPLMVIANHVSWTDILVIGAAAAPVCFLAKSEVAGWPGLGWFARVQRTLFVPRGRKRAIPAVNRAIADRLATGEPVVLFAEATTGDGNRLKRFNAPHVAACRDLLAARPLTPEVAIQPVALVYERRDGMALTWIERLAVAWTGDTAFAPHLASLLAGGRIGCRIVFGEPFAFVRGDDRKAAARRAAAEVRALRARPGACVAPAATAPGDDRAAVLLKAAQTA